MEKSDLEKAHDNYYDGSSITKEGEKADTYIDELEKEVEKLKGAN